MIDQLWAVRHDSCAVPGSIPGTKSWLPIYHDRDYRHVMNYVKYLLSIDRGRNVILSMMDFFSNLYPSADIYLETTSSLATLIPDQQVKFSGNLFLEKFFYWILATSIQL